MILYDMLGFTLHAWTPINTERSILIGYNDSLCTEPIQKVKQVIVDN